MKVFYTNKSFARGSEHFSVFQLWKAVCVLLLTSMTAKMRLSACKVDRGFFQPSPAGNQVYAPSTAPQNPSQILFTCSKSAENHFLPQCEKLLTQLEMNDLWQHPSIRHGGNKASVLGMGNK